VNAWFPLSSDMAPIYAAAVSPSAAQALRRARNCWTLPCGPAGALPGGHKDHQWSMRRAMEKAER
jgi:hypothetical protein